jgi:hypothetical protein
MLVHNKKKWVTLLSLILFLTFPGKAQTHLQLILHTEKPIDSAFIVHWTDRESAWLPFTDTMQVDFKTTGIDFYHLNFKISDKKNYFASVFLDTGRIQLVAHIENEKIIIDSVTGSPMYKKYSAWKAEYNRLKSGNDSAALDRFLLKSYGENLDNLFSFQIGTRYVDIHQNDKLKLYALLPMIEKQTEETKRQFGFSILNDRLRGILAHDTIDLSHYPLLTRNNEVTQAKSLDSKFVILDFWFVACLPCVADHQKITALFPGLKQKKTEFISISNDDSFVKWKDYLEKHDYTWQHYKKIMDGNSIIEQIGITTYPSYLLLDAKGKIIYTTYLLEEMIRKLEDMK